MPTFLKLGDVIINADYSVSALDNPAAKSLTVEFAATPQTPTGNTAAVAGLSSRPSQLHCKTFLKTERDALLEWFSANGLTDLLAPPSDVSHGPSLFR